MRCAGLLQWLRRRDFDIGVDQQLLAETLLARWGDSIGPGELKTLLAPIVARNAREQERFYQEFDAFFPPAAAAAAAAADARTSAARRSTPGTTPGGAAHADEPGDAGRRARRHPSRRPRRPQRARVAIAALAAVVAMLVVTDYRPDWIDPKNGPDTAAGPADTLVGGTKPPPLGQSSLVREDPLLLAGATAPPDQAGVADEPAPLWRRRGARELMAALPLLLVALWLSIGRAVRAMRRRPPAPAAPGPLAVPPHPPAVPAQPFVGEEFLVTARSVRRRERGEQTRLSVDRSVGATIAAAGFPTLRFDAVTRPPEYLVLIERAAARDHQARYYEALAERLGKEGATVERYFFEADPRTCFPSGSLPPNVDPATTSFRLADLLRRHDRARVLVFGGGAAFIHPETGELWSWTEMLEEVTHRALLTPEPPRAWGFREVALASRFVLVPGSLEGMRAAVGHFEDGTRSDLQRWVSRSSDRTPPSSAGRLPNVTELRAYLGPDVFQWLCACAVYPELHWELTLHLGSLPNVGRGLLTEARLRSLVRLPWFRRGVMPAPVRELLIAHLGRGAEDAAREAVIEMLKRRSAAAGSNAEERRQADLLAQRLFYYRDEPREQRDALRAAAAAPHEVMAQDAAVGRLVAAMNRGRLGTRLPLRLRRLVFPDGMPAFGRRPWTTGAAAAGAAVLLGATVLAAHPGPEEKVDPPPPSPVVSTIFLSVVGADLVEGDTLRVRGWPIGGDGRPLPDTLLRWATAPGSRGESPSDSNRSLVAGTGYADVVIPADSIWVRAIVEGPTSSWSSNIHVAVSPRPAAGGPEAPRVVRLLARWVLAADSASFAPDVARPVDRTTGRRAPLSATTWRSCSPGILRVDSSGVAVASRPGATTVVASTGNWTEYGAVLIPDTAAGGAPIALTDVDTLLMPLPVGADGVSLDGEGDRLLEAKSRALARQPGVRLRLVGHLPPTPTTVVGRPSASLRAAGARQAASVRDRMAKLSPRDASRIVADGAEAPCPNFLTLTEVDTAGSRRVEFELADSRGTLPDGDSIVVVPIVLGVDLDSARRVLGAVGLGATPVLESVAGARALLGRVIRQSPAGGGPIRPGGTVTLAIARPPACAAVDQPVRARDAIVPPDAWRILTEVAYFGPGAALLPGQRAVLDRKRATLAVQQPSVRLRVSGHVARSDFATGQRVSSPQEQSRLATLRARTAADSLLVHRLVDSTRIEVVARGAECQLPAGFPDSLNRRVTFEVVVATPGADSVVVPNVVDLEIEAAGRRLGQVGLRSRRDAVFTGGRDTIKRVVSQLPRVGSIVPRETVVELTYIADADSLVVSMPQLFRFRLDRAIATLRELGLSVGGVDTTGRVSAPEDSVPMVVTQSPVAGGTVRRGTAIRLGVGIRASTEAASEGLTRAEIRAQLRVVGMRSEEPVRIGWDRAWAGQNGELRVFGYMDSDDVDDIAPGASSPVQRNPTRELHARPQSLRDLELHVTANDSVWVLGFATRDELNAVLRVAGSTRPRRVGLRVSPDSGAPCLIAVLLSAVTQADHESKMAPAGTEGVTLTVQMPVPDAEGTRSPIIVPSRSLALGCGRLPASAR